MLFCIIGREDKGGGIIKISCEQIVEQYGDMVYRIALCNAKNKEDAEDIFQEVFVSLIRSLDKIENENHLKHWLIRTTINKCKNLHLCFWKKRVSLEDTKLEEKYISGSKGFNDEVNELRAEINTLSDKQKSVIYLYYYEGFSVKEIAKILKISEGTVKSRLSSARNNLKINLERGYNG